MEDRLKKMLLEVEKDKDINLTGYLVSDRELLRKILMSNYVNSRLNEELVKEVNKSNSLAYQDVLVDASISLGVDYISENAFSLISKIVQSKENQNELISSIELSLDKDNSNMLNPSIIDVDSLYKFKLGMQILKRINPEFLNNPQFKRNNKL